MCADKANEYGRGGWDGRIERMMFLFNHYDMYEWEPDGGFAQSWEEKIVVPFHTEDWPTDETNRTSSYLGEQIVYEAEYGDGYKFKRPPEACPCCWNTRNLDGLGFYDNDEKKFKPKQKLPKEKSKQRRVLIKKPKKEKVVKLPKHLFHYDSGIVMEAEMDALRVGSLKTLLAAVPDDGIIQQKPTYHIGWHNMTYRDVRIVLMEEGQIRYTEQLVPLDGEQEQLRLYE